MTSASTSTPGLRGYLGIDNGTQGLSVVFTDEDLNVLATGEGSYDMVAFDEDAGATTSDNNGSTEGWYEQNAHDWDAALRTAMDQVRHQLGNAARLEVLGIGISGQMHGQVLCDGDGEPLGPARLWCDVRNAEEGKELTQLFGCKIPKRCTVARWLWTLRRRPEQAKRVRHMTTPAGWTSYRLTGQWSLGVGDAAGMFPVDAAQGTYDATMLQKFDALLTSDGSGIDKESVAEFPDLDAILPTIRRAGQPGGYLSASGAQLLGISLSASESSPPNGDDKDSANRPIPVAAAEGDQPAALAGSLIARAGMASISFGTSVCANVVAPSDHAFVGVQDLIDHFCAPDGKPIHMVWLRNGTTFLNSIVRSFARNDDADIFDVIMPLLCAASPDCGGLLALPFLDDEPGMHVAQGGTAMLIGLNGDNATPGNMAKAALLSTMFNLKIGCGVLQAQGIPLTELVLTGGLSKTPQCGQILADVFDLPVTLLESADEGCSWGAAVMAKYTALQQEQQQQKEKGVMSWTDFLDTIAKKQQRRQFVPHTANVPIYARMFARYRRLLELQPQLSQAVNE